MIAESPLMSIRSVMEALSGKILPEAVNPQQGISSVTIDSRNVTEGALFVALPGTVTDGHAYVEKAFQQGAVFALVQENRMEQYGATIVAAARGAGKNVMVVPDTLRALQDLARWYVDRFPHLIRVGITGSSGKTTTKEIAAAMIRSEKVVVMNEGNLNSETGLPLSVFSIRPEHQVGVFELGMNRVGEITELARVLRPHIALITNIGTAHIGKLGSQEAIAREKKEIFSQFTGREVAIIPESDPFAAFLKEGVRGRIRSFGYRSMVSLGEVTPLGIEGTRIVWDGVPVILPLPGTHNVLNALGAAAIAQEVGISAEGIRQGIAQVRPLFGRGEIIKGPVTILRDCYNANPESMEQAVGFCDSLEWKGKRVYVIGSMLELGEKSEEAHRQIAHVLAKSKADRIFLFGEETAIMEPIVAATKGSAAVGYTTSFDELQEKVRRSVEEGDLVLLKGSRGMALERLTEILTGEKNVL
ncbi:UDP-N-acetylmuramoyl-tripeptide--D-alanyl-D-alanine ligase [Treponema sp. J25]|uniref:UDP-N-acetylmuramoyl-tripeptide--D-alanyl-D- alanine ligase n=1 Tax=Treponema sp. J25 TaxID=2094121 RepID=UPI001FB5B419|nr:UDP-N-acetylmuramoyl-tripeptide--D-alanyl-D-alanine ligase [Treponema sp. J25]